MGVNALLNRPSKFVLAVAGTAVPAPIAEVDGDAFARIDELEQEMMGHPAVELPLVHRFTPGLYIREIFMPAGALVTSKIHLTEHPFTISKGRVSVLIAGDEWVELSAPHTGITKPGTRRVLYIHEDTIWTTYHPNPENTEDLAEIEARIICPHREHLEGLEQPPSVPEITEGVSK